MCGRDRQKVSGRERERCVWKTMRKRECRREWGREESGNKKYLKKS